MTLNLAAPVSISAIIFCSAARMSALVFANAAVHALIQLGFERNLPASRGEIP